MLTHSRPSRSSLAKIAFGLLGGLALQAALPGAARADVIKVTADAAAYGYDTATLHDTGLLLGNGTHAEAVYTGGDTITALDQTTGTTESLIVWCTDIAHNLSTPTTYTTGLLASNVTDPTKLAQITTLIDVGAQYLATKQTFGYSATEFSSALQLAIWTAEYQSGTTNYNVSDTSRNFYATNLSDANDAILANAMLSEVSGSLSAPANVYAVQLQDSTGSQQLSYTAVPEPASLALLGAGLLGMVGFRLRRRTAASLA